MTDEAAETDPFQPLPLRLASRKWLLTRYLSGRVALWRESTSLLPQADQARATALDIGCGQRPFDRALALRGFQVVGTDRVLLPDTIQADVDLLPFRDDAFSLTLCANIFQYVEDPAISLREVKRILVPGGTLIGVFPCFVPLAQDDRWRWTEVSMHRLLAETGFVDVIARPIMPTGANLLAILGLSIRNAVPFIGWIPAIFMEALALALLRTRDTRLVGGFAVRARNEK